MSERYRTFGLNVTSLPDRSMLAYNRLTGTTHRLSPAEQNLLRFCATPRTLDEHVAAYVSHALTGQAEQLSTASGSSLRRFVRSWAARKLATRSAAEVASIANAEALNAMLEWFVGNGLLTSDARLHAEFATSHHAPPDPGIGVSTIGISTSDRTASLQRLLESLLHNLRQFGHSPTLLVADDSRSPAAIDANRQVLAEICRTAAGRAIHLTRSDRAMYAELLAGQTHVDLDVAKFALLGDESLGLTYGAARNTMLLCAAGSLSLQLDDDIVCRLSDEEDGTSPLTINSGSAGEYHFYEDLAGCVTSHPEAVTSLLDLHTVLLGRRAHEHIAARLDGEAHIADLSVDLFSRLSLQDHRVGITSMGIAGGSGMERPEQRLFLTGSSHERFVASEAAFRNGLTTDYLVRTATAWTISDGSFFMAAGTGFDLRDVLPPFSPSLRNEDGVYSATLRFCSPSILQGMIPYTILHAPPGNRKHRTVTARPLRSNDILRLIIYCWQPWPLDTRRSSGYELLGRYLIELSTLKPADFRELVHGIISGALADDLAFLQRRTVENSGRPEYWLRCVREYQAALMQAVETPAYFAPADLKGEISLRMSILQAYIGKFGQIVLCWQQLFETARQIPLDQFVAFNR